MGNLVRKTFTADGSFVAPAGVTSVVVRAIQRNYFGVNGGVTATNGVQNVTTFIDEDKNGYASGFGTNGQIGNGVATSVSSPVLIIGGNKWIKIAASFSNYGLTDNGELWSWGLNGQGQLGNGTQNTNQSSPVQILNPSARKWVDVSTAYDANAGAGFAAALDETGAAYTFGYGGSGQLGNGAAIPTAASSPVLVVGGQTFKKIVCGSRFVLGLTSAGAVYAWGDNTSGQLGDGTTTGRSSPVLVVGGQVFVDIAASGSDSVTGGSSYGLTAAGAAYAWGLNTSGQLGDGTVVPKSSPVLVLGGNVFAKIYANLKYAFALKSDGTAYFWGTAASGTSGTGSSTSTQSSPVLVAGSTKFQAIAPSGLNVLAQGLDGKMYSWGANQTGELMQGNVTPLSSPVQIAAPKRSRLVSDVFTQTFAVTPGTTYAIALSTFYATFGGNNVGYVCDQMILEFYE